VIPASSRLAIWCIALLLSLSLYMKGRVPTRKGEDAAPFRFGAETVTVRLAGDFPRPGVYLLPKGAVPATAIKMTLPGSALALPSAGAAAALLSSGDVVTLKLAGEKYPVISITKMGVRERMLLGVPLDPDRMEPAEWSLLPGIGPVLAARIAADRQKNGAFHSLDGLLRVPGIGPGKLSAIRRYF